MSRYELERFHPKPDPDLVCSICQSVLDTPLQTTCNHVFCKICIETWLTNKHNCPHCRKRTRLRDLKPVLPILRNLLNRLMVRCKNFQMGCLMDFQMEFVLDHEESCPHEPVKCRYNKCTALITKINKDEHEKNCDYMEIQCTKACRLMILAKDKDHDCLLALRAHVEEQRSELTRLRERARQLEEEKSQLSRQLSEVRRQLNEQQQVREDHVDLMEESQSSAESNESDGYHDDYNSDEDHDEDEPDEGQNNDLYEDQTDRSHTPGPSDDFVSNWQVDTSPYYIPPHTPTYDPPITPSPEIVAYNWYATPSPPQNSPAYNESVPIPPSPLVQSPQYFMESPVGTPMPSPAASGGSVANSPAHTHDSNNAYHSYQSEESDNNADRSFQSHGLYDHNESDIDEQRQRDDEEDEPPVDDYSERYSEEWSSDSNNNTLVNTENDTDQEDSDPESFLSESSQEHSTQESDSSSSWSSSNRHRQNFTRHTNSKRKMNNLGSDPSVKRRRQ